MSEDFSLSTVKEKINSSKKIKLTTYIVGGLIALFAIYMLYRMFFIEPANTESKGSY